MDGVDDTEEWLQRLMDACEAGLYRTEAAEEDQTPLELQPRMEIVECIEGARRVDMTVRVNGHAYRVVVLELIDVWTFYVRDERDREYLPESACYQAPREEALSMALHVARFHGERRAP